MAQSGMAVPTYAYAANNPLLYTDPTGLDLHVAWSNYLFSNAEDVAKLQRVVDKLNAPSGAAAAGGDGAGGSVDGLYVRRARETGVWECCVACQKS